MIRRVIDYLRPPPVDGVAGMRRLLSGEASYLAQRVTYEFTRNTLGWFGQSAFGSDDFNAALRVCRWETWAAILAGNVLLAEGALRPHAEARHEALAAALLAEFDSMLAEYAVPAHRPSWDEVRAALAARLAAAALAPPADASALGLVAAARAVDTLPARSANPAEDRRTIETALRFGMVAFADQLRRRLRPAPVARALLAR